MLRNKQILSFDTNYAELKTIDKVVFSTRANIQASRKYVEMELISLELNLSFTNVRTENKSNLLSLVVNGTPYNILITSMHYSKIDDLIAEINSRLLATLPSTLAITAAVSTPAYLIHFVLGPSITSFVINPSPLVTSILGFTSPTLIASGKVVSTNPFNLNAENYISMHILQVSDSSQFNNPFVIGAFKIPLLVSFGSILFYSQSFYNNYIKSNVAYAINDTLSVCFYDRYGCRLNMQNLEFSFSFMFSE